MKRTLLIAALALLSIGLTIPQRIFAQDDGDAPLSQPDGGAAPALACQTDPSSYYGGVYNPLGDAKPIWDLNKVMGDPPVVTGDISPCQPNPTVDESYAVRIIGDSRRIIQLAVWDQRFCGDDGSGILNFDTSRATFNSRARNNIIGVGIEMADDNVTARIYSVNNPVRCTSDGGGPPVCCFELPPPPF